MGGEAPGGGVFYGRTRRDPVAMSDSGYLTNQLLIAMPAMGDPNFAQTVALVCDHGSAARSGSS